MLRMNSIARTMLQMKTFGISFYLFRLRFQFLNISSFQALRVLCYKNNLNLIKTYYKELKNPANKDDLNPLAISDYFYDIENIDYITGSYRNSSAVPNKILRCVHLISLRYQTRSPSLGPICWVWNIKRDIQARMIKIEASIQKDGAVEWPKSERMSPFPYTNNQHYLQISSDNAQDLINGSFSDEEKTNFLNSKISFCSQMLLYDKISQAKNQAVLHQGKTWNRPSKII